LIVPQTERNNCPGPSIVHVCVRCMAPRAVGLWCWWHFLPARRERCKTLKPKNYHRSRKTGRFLPSTVITMNERFLNINGEALNLNDIVQNINRVTSVGSHKRRSNSQVAQARTWWLKCIASQRGLGTRGVCCLRRFGPGTQTSCPKPFAKKCGYPRKRTAEQLWDHQFS